MFAQVQLFPDQASTNAASVDTLFLFLCAITAAMAILIAVLVIGFALRYRRRSDADQTPRIVGSLRLELFWSITPLFVFAVIFFWGASVYLSLTRPPDDAIEVYVVGKQWMWKLQHQGGQREINELHVPVNQPVKLILTSEDVIHDFFVPAFRTKVDVLPGRYVTTWFQATKIDDYHLFCAQYCGTMHSRMVGTIHVLSEEDYKTWLDQHAEGSLALKGRKLFLKLQCVSCHSGDAKARAPNLEGLYGQTVYLQNGPPVLADDAYLHESILRPRAKIVAGWQPIMPSYDGQLADPTEDLTQEEALIQLLAYIQSLGPNRTPVRTEEFPPPAVNPASPEEERKP
jgi:cytochrome c oxidase subunit II